MKINKLTTPEKEVVNAIKGIARLPYRNNTLKHFKKHEKAIEQLKNKGIIQKGEHGVLEIIDVMNTGCGRKVLYVAHNKKLPIDIIEQITRLVAKQHNFDFRIIETDDFISGVIIGFLNKQ